MAGILGIFLYISHHVLLATYVSHDIILLMYVMALWNVVYKHYDNQRFLYVNERHFGFMLITYQYNHTKFESN